MQGTLDEYRGPSQQEIRQSYRLDAGGYARGETEKNAPAFGYPRWKRNNPFKSDSGIFGSNHDLS
jgi:hypothetical protein